MKLKELLYYRDGNNLSAAIYFGPEGTSSPPFEKDTDSGRPSHSASSGAMGAITCKGYLVSSWNGNSIFLPAAGRWAPILEDEDDLHYWSSSLSDNGSDMARFLNSSTLNYCERELGLSVRPVSE